MSHINGRAGWRKSPSPDLARGRDRVTARPTLQARFDAPAQVVSSGLRTGFPLKSAPIILDDSVLIYDPMDIPVALYRILPAIASNRGTLGTW